MLTPIETIRARLLQAYDPDYYDSLYRQMQYAFGEPWRKKSGVTSGPGGNVPDRPDIVVRFQEVGRSRRILNTQFIALSRIMYSQPQPEFPQLDKWTGEVRKQFYLSRYEGTGCGEGEWADEMAAAYMDGDGLGFGCVQIGLRTNPDTNQQQVHLMHVPAIHVYGDRLERNPGRWRFIAFQKYLPVDVAIERWGKDAAEMYTRRLFDSATSTSLEVVRVFEYYDLGLATGGKPTMCVIGGDLGGEPLEVPTENPFGRCLPFSYYLHFLAPGMRYACGRIAMQMATQEAINEIERGMRRVFRLRGFDVVDPSQLDPNDLKRLDAGDDNVRVRRTSTKPGIPAYERVPAGEAAVTWMQLREMYDRQFNADSGTTEFDRGNMSEEKRTLGENQLLVQRSSAQSSWSDLQATKFHRRTAEKVLAIAAQHDRDPLVIDYFGQGVPLNVPDLPASCIANFMTKPSRVVIGEDSLKKSDLKNERAEKLSLLQLVAPYVGTLFDPSWFGLSMAKAIGEEDPRAALLNGGEPQQMAAAPGAPQQGLPAMGMGGMR